MSDIESAPLDPRSAAELLTNWGCTVSFQSSLRSSVHLCAAGPALPCPALLPLQVIEDTVTVVQHVQKERHVPLSVPNIVIGGSYGG